MLVAITLLGLVADGTSVRYVGFGLTRRDRVFQRVGVSCSGMCVIIESTPTNGYLDNMSRREGARHT